MLHRLLPIALLMLVFTLAACGGPAAPMPTLAVLPTNVPATAVPTKPPASPAQAATAAPTAQANRTAAATVPPAASDSGGASTVQREKVDCLRLREIFRALKPDEVVEFPADFPTPPQNANACGVDAPGNMHYASDMAPAAVIAYYKEKLAVRGCTDPREDLPRPGEPVLSMKCKDGLAVITTNSYVTEFLVRLTAQKK